MPRGGGPSQPTSLDKLAARRKTVRRTPTCELHRTLLAAVEIVGLVCGSGTGGDLSLVDVHAVRALSCGCEGPSHEGLRGGC